MRYAAALALGVVCMLVSRAIVGPLSTMPATLIALVLAIAIAVAVILSIPKDRRDV